MGAVIPNTVALMARLDDADQAIVLLPVVLEHMARYRQDSWWKREAGGQLFASLTDTHLEVCLATGPYRGDFRARHGYRSKPASAQREIQRQRGHGLYYCGDWHTHPQAVPIASAEDLGTIAKLQAHSDLRLPTVLMVIQGTEPAPDGVAIYSCNAGHTQKWRVEKHHTN